MVQYECTCVHSAARQRAFFSCSNIQQRARTLLQAHQLFYTFTTASALALDGRAHESCAVWPTDSTPFQILSFPFAKHGVTTRKAARVELVTTQHRASRWALLTLSIEMGSFGDGPSDQGETCAPLSSVFRGLNLHLHALQRIFLSRLNQPG